MKRAHPPKPKPRSRATNPLGPLAPEGDDTPATIAGAPPPRAAPGDTDADRQYALDAERAREDLVARVKDLSWQGAPLLPWSEERARLLDALCAADIPAPDLASCDETTFIHGAFPRAVKILYLSLHQPEEWQAQRPRLLAVIDRWGVMHVPGASVADKIAALNITLTIERAHLAVQVMYQPRASGGHSGN